MKVLKEFVFFVHCAVGMFVLLLAAGLLPGDGFDVDTVGALEGIIMLILLDGLLTGPVYWLARRRGVTIPNPFRR